MMRTMHPQLALARQEEMVREAAARRAARPSPDPGPSVGTQAGGGVADERYAGANAESLEAWDGPLFDRFVRFRPVVTTGLAVHGERALRLYSPARGERVLDLGCGFGDTTLRLAGLVGPEGSAVGVDGSRRFIEQAEAEARAAGVGNVAFFAGDVQEADLRGPYDMAFSRFGTMFFANPVAALRNVRRSLVPGGRLVMVVWRRREDNGWLHRGQRIVEGIVSRPESYEEPTCGPGPFSMADADTVSDILRRAGFSGVALHRCDLPIAIGSDVEDAVDFVMALGPAGEILRLAGERAADRHEEVREALRAGLAQFRTTDGLRAPASTWIVSAVCPPAGS